MDSACTYCTDEEFWRFVDGHIADSPVRLRLKYASKDAVGPIDYALAITQIECRQRFGAKLAQTLARYPHFLFADRLAGEQSTSDALASWHASLIGSSVAAVTDLTAGLGIDCMHIAAKVAAVTAIERKPPLAEALAANAHGLGLDNIKVLCGDSMELLANGSLHGDVVFADPARRDNAGGRVFALSDCEPDAKVIIEKARTKFATAIFKMSPMLDVTQTVRDLGGCLDIYAVGTPTECKELVAVVDLQNAADTSEPHIHAVTLTSTGISTFSYTATEEAEAPAAPVSLPRPGDFVIEPWPAIMKAAPYKLIASRYSLLVIDANTHVFHTPTAPAADIPGNVYVVEALVPWQSKELKRFRRRWPRAQVAVRNFGMTAQALRAKLGIAEGDDVRVLGVTAGQTRALLVLTKP